MKTLRSLFALAAVLISPGAAHALALSSAPAPFPLCWGASAGAGFIRTIPTASQIGIQNGAASLTDGFPPLTFQSVAAGGVPPFGADMNGILNQLSCNVQWGDSIGEPATWASSFSTAIGGYPKGSIVQSATTPGTFWRATTDNNTTNPDASGAGWAAWNFVPAVGGNAATATTLQTPRTISSTGDVAWSVTFNGSANVAAGGTIQPGAVTGSKIAFGTVTGGNISAGTVASSNMTGTGVGAGSYGSVSTSSTQVPSLTIDSAGRVTAASATSIPIAAPGTNGLAQLASNAQAIDASNFQESETPGALAANTGVSRTCGTSCLANYIIYPGNLILVMGVYDCGSTSCWNGSSITVTTPAGSFCYSAVADAYNPANNSSPHAAVQVASATGGTSWTFNTASNGQTGSLEGFTFMLNCHV